MKTLDKELWDILMKETKYNGCTSKIKDPDNVFYEVRNGNGIHRTEVVADVEYKEMKDDNY